MGDVSTVEDKHGALCGPAPRRTPFFFGTHLFNKVGCVLFLSQSGSGEFASLERTCEPSLRSLPQKSRDIVKGDGAMPPRVLLLRNSEILPGLMVVVAMQELMVYGEFREHDFHSSKEDC